MSRPMLKQRRTLKGHLGRVVSVAWSTDSRHLLSAAQDGKMVLWDTYTTNKVQVINCQSSWIMTCAVSPTGRLVAAGGLDNICSVYNLKEAEAALSQGGKDAAGLPTHPTKALDGHVGFVSGIKFLNDTQLITSSADQTCSLWDIDRGLQTTFYKGHEQDVMGIALLRDSNSGAVTSFVSISGDSSARLWDIRSGRCERIFYTEEANQDLLNVDAFPDGSAFACGSEDSAVRLFDIRADRMLQKYADQALMASETKTNVTGVSFTHSGRAIVVAYDNDTVRLWDTFRADQVSHIKAHEERVTAVAVSPDGNGLATGSWDKVVKIWA